MKESEAWVILAEEFDGQREECFLCVVLTSPFVHLVDDKIPLDLRLKTEQRIQSQLDPLYSCAYLDGEDDTYDARVLACLLFAAIAEDEESENGTGFAE